MNPLKTLRRVRDSGLSTTEKVVLVCVVLRCDARGSTWVGAHKLAQDCSLAERTVRRALADLGAQGVLDLLPRPGRTPLTRVNVRAILPRTEDPGSTDTPDRGSGVPRTEDPDTPDRGSDDLPKNYPTDLPNSLSVEPTDPTQEKDPMFTLTPPEPAPDGPHEQAARVAGYWWDLWKTRAEAHRGKGRCPGQPRKLPEGDRIPSEVLTCVRRFDLEEIRLVLRWAFTARCDHAAHMRGEARSKTVYLTLTNLLRPGKFADKLAKAQTWEDSGAPLAASRALAGGHHYSPKATAPPTQAELDALAAF